MAARFLTRLPLPEVDLRDDDLARATGLFPLVGLVIAAIAGVVYWGVASLVGGPLAAVVAVASAVAVTGAFHEDGLADVCDGWFGGFTPERRVEIMRDSRLGTFGAAGLALVLAARVVLLLDLAPMAVFEVLAAGHVVGRAGILVALWVGPVAPAGSLSRLVARGVPWWSQAIGLATAGGIAVATTGVWAPVMVALVAAIAIAMALWSRHKVGGVTGDVLGAIAQLGHVAAAAVVVAVVT